MSTGLATLATYDKFLKIVYGKVAQVLLHNNALAYETFGKSDVKFSGRQHVYPLVIDRNPGLGWAAENSDLPPAGSHTPKDVTIKTKFFYARGQITNQTMEFSKSDDGAFEEGLQHEMDGTFDDCVDEFDMGTYLGMDRDGTGTTLEMGVRAITNGSGAGADVSVPSGVSTAVKVKGAGGYRDGSDGAEAFIKNGVHYLNDGMTIRVGTAAALAASGTGGILYTIDDVVDEETIKVTQTTGAATTWEGSAGSLERVVRGSAKGNDLAGQAMNGLGAIIYDKGTLDGVDRATTPKWRASRLKNGGVARALSFALLQQAENQVYHRSGGKLTHIFMSPAGVIEHQKIVTLNQRYLISGTKAPSMPAGHDGSFTYAGGHGNTPIIPHRRCPPGMALFVDARDFKMYEGLALEFDDKGGGILKWVADRDAYEFRLRAYVQLHCRNPLHQVRLEDIAMGPEILANL